MNVYYFEMLVILLLRKRKTLPEMAGTSLRRQKPALKADIDRPTATDASDLAILNALLKSMDPVSF
jgi:hypothetical protein